SIIPPTPTSALFPYTTLFRSFLSKTWVSIRTPAEHISGGRIGSRRRLFERQDTRYAQQFRRASTALVRLRSRPSSRSNGNFAHATHTESHRPARSCSRYLWHRV